MFKKFQKPLNGNIPPLEDTKKIVDDISNEQKILELTARLREAEEEIEGLLQECKLPIQQSKVAAKKRQKEQQANFEERHFKYLNDLEAITLNFNERVNELNQAIINTENFKFELDEYEEKLQALESALKEEKDSVAQKLESKRIELDAVYDEKKHQLDVEKDEMIKRFESQSEEMKVKYEELTNKLNKELEQEMSEFEDDLSERAKILEDEYSSLEKQLEIDRVNFETDCHNKIAEIRLEIERLKSSTEEEILEKNKELDTMKAKKDCLKKDIEGLEKKKVRKVKYVKFLDKLLRIRYAVVSIILLVIISLGLMAFGPHLLKKTTVEGSANNVLKSPYNEISASILTSVNNETIFKGQYFRGYNDFLGEELSTFTLSDYTNNYTWERYNKGNAAFLKTPYDPQYIFSEDYTLDGITYLKNEILGLNTTLIRQAVSEMNITSSYLSGADTSDNVFKNFLYFWKNKLFPSNILYEFKFNPSIASKIYLSISNSSIYQNFINEEKFLQSKLKVEDVVEGFDSTLKDVFTNVNYSESYGSAVIDNGDLSTLILNLRGTNSNGDSVSVFITINLKITDKEKSYDNSEFILNSMPYSQIYPRVHQDNFKESENANEIKENVTTVEDLENKGFKIE